MRAWLFTQEVDAFCLLPGLCADVDESPGSDPAHLYSPVRGECQQEQWPPSMSGAPRSSVSLTFNCGGDKKKVSPWRLMMQDGRDDSAALIFTRALSGEKSGHVSYVTGLALQRAHPVTSQRGNRQLWIHICWVPKSPMTLNYLMC